jgi:hypothetical protein
MRKEKELVALLRGLAELLAEEARRNPNFASQLELLLSSLPRREVNQPKLRKNTEEKLPDLYAEWTTRGEAGLLLWLRECPLAVLRSLIRSNDFDPIGRTSKWKETEKLSSFIVDSLRARMTRGSAFMRKGPVS